MACSFLTIKEQKVKFLGDDVKHCKDIEILFDWLHLDDCLCSNLLYYFLVNVSPL